MLYTRFAYEVALVLARKYASSIGKRAFRHTKPPYDFLYYDFRKLRAYIRFSS